MTATIELLDRFKAANGGVSDYRVAKILGVPQPTISKYRCGDIQMSPDRMISMCEMMGIDPAPYLVRLHIDVAKGAREREVWKHVAARLAA